MGDRFIVQKIVIAGSGKDHSVGRIKQDPGKNLISKHESRILKSIHASQIQVLVKQTAVGTQLPSVECTFHKIRPLNTLSNSVPSTGTRRFLPPPGISPYIDGYTISAPSDFFEPEQNSQII